MGTSAARAAMPGPRRAELLLSAVMPLLCSADSVERLGHGGPQVVPWKRRRWWRYPDQVSPGPPPVVTVRENGPQPAAKPVALDGVPDRTADGEGHPRRYGGISWDPPYRDRAAPEASAGAAQQLERGTVPDPPHLPGAGPRNRLRQRAAGDP